MAERVVAACLNVVVVGASYNFLGALVGLLHVETQKAWLPAACVVSWFRERALLAALS